MIDPYGLIVRANTSDQGTWHDVFDEDKRYHRPPASIVFNPKLVLDLGAYVGYTCVDFHNLWPNAEIICCEPNEDNLKVLHQNTAGIPNKLVFGFAIGDQTMKGRLEGSHLNNQVFIQDIHGELECVLIDLLTSNHIDYIKMDIEGAEKQVLKVGGRWPQNTGCIKVELHGDYSTEEALTDLKQLGFDSWRDSTHPACVIGVR